MNSALLARFTVSDEAFGHPVTLAIAVAVAGLLVLTPLLVALLGRLGKVDAKGRRELWRRYLSWLVLAPAMVVPILLGPGWTVLAVGLLSLLCYREYALATGLFREKTLSVVVVLGVVLLTLANLDHWYGLFVALPPLVVGTIATASVLADRPQGYIQRVALAVLGFVLFGSGLAHLGFLANDADYRPILLLVVLAVELNDIFAYVSGKTFGRRRLAPRTSPNKTLGGALGALLLTTALVAGCGRWVFAGTPLAGWGHLVVLGVLVSVMGQVGDLILSSIKRDLGIKDMAATLPGHGGLLDRFDSLILVAPVVFHYVHYFAGVAAGLPARIVTGVG